MMKLSSLAFLMAMFAIGGTQGAELQCINIQEWNLDPANFPDRQISLSCPDGYVSVSGGAECYDYGNWMGRLTKSFPYENGWAATCQNFEFNGVANNEGAQIIKVMHARCCKLKLQTENSDAGAGGGITITSGYVDLDTTNGSLPEPSHCLNESDYGRLVVDEVSSIIYVCTQSGWTPH